MISMNLTKSRHSLVLAAFLIALTFAGGQFARAAEHEKHTPLDDAMEAMNKAYKALKAQVGDSSKNANSLELIAEMEKQALIAKGMTPARAAKLSESERPKFIAEYRKAVANLIGEYLKIETALLEGKNADAEKIVGTISKIKEAAHEKFQEE
jgi:hypothetical protein